MYKNLGINGAFIKYAIAASIIVHALVFTTYSYISQNKIIIHEIKPASQSISLNFSSSPPQSVSSILEIDDKPKLEAEPIKPITPDKEEIKPEPVKAVEVEKKPEIKQQSEPKLAPKKPEPKKIEKPEKKVVKKQPIKKIVKPKKAPPKKVVKKIISPKKVEKPLKTVNKTPKPTIKKPAQKQVDKPTNSTSITPSNNSNTSQAAQFKGKRKIPKYPKRARMKGLEGTVILVALIDIDGKIKKLKDVQIFKSSGYKELDRAAQKAMWKDSFNPKYVNGTPVKHWGKALYKFFLR